MKPYYETANGKLYHGNAVNIMAELPQVDLTVTSPPYDNLRDYEGYDFDFEKMAQGLKVITKDGGVVVWVVGDATVNGSETGTSFRQALYFKDIGFNLHDTMIYQKLCYMPLTHNRYENVFEYMFVLSKNRPAVFNPKMKINITKGNLITGNRRHNGNDLSPIHLHGKRKKDKGIEVNVWKYKTGWNHSYTDKIVKGHPAVMPERLAHDHIISWSNESDTIFDPMCGSGTVPKMAERLNRKWLACEISEKYCEIIAKRVESEASQLKLFR